MKISMKLVYRYMVIFFKFSPPTSNHVHPQQVKNCDSNSRLVVDDNGKFKLERVKYITLKNIPILNFTDFEVVPRVNPYNAEIFKYKL